MATFYVKVVNTMQLSYIYEVRHVINIATYFLFVTRQMLEFVFCPAVITTASHTCCSSKFHVKPRQPMCECIITCCSTIPVRILFISFALVVFKYNFYGMTLGPSTQNTVTPIPCTHT